MEPDYRAQWHPAAAEFERHRTAKAEPDRGDPFPVNVGLIDKNLVADERKLGGGGRVGEQLSETSLCPLQRMLVAATEVVQRKRHVASIGEPVGAGADVVVLAAAFVQEQHARPLAVLARVVHREVANHCRVECLVLDAFGSQHETECTATLSPARRFTWPTKRAPNDRKPCPERWIRT